MPPDAADGYAPLGELSARKQSGRRAPRRCTQGAQDALESAAGEAFCVLALIDAQHG